MVEGLEHELGRRGTGEIQADHLQVGQAPQCSEECHGLAGAGRPTEQQGLVFFEPRGQETLVADGVDGGHDHVRRRDCLVRKFDRGYLALPRGPLARLQEYLSLKYEN